MVDMEGMVEIGCEKEFSALLRGMREKSCRKNVVVAMKEPQGHVKTMMAEVLRDKKGVVWWEGVAEGWMQLREKVKEEQEIKTRKQIVMVASHRGVVCRLLEELKAQMRWEGKRKVIVFFATARLAECYAEIGRAGGFKVVDLTAKSSVGKRMRELETFHLEEKGVLFSSDLLTKDAVLTAVDCVVQVGLPQTKEQYRSRVALLGEGGEDRYAMLIIADVEQETVKRELELEEGVEWCEYKEEGGDWRAEGKSEIWDENGMRRGYESWLAYYRHCRKRLGWTRPELVAHGNDWAEQVLGGVPILEKKVINRLYLRDVVGIRAPIPKK